MEETETPKENECTKKCMRNKHTNIEGQLVAVSHMIYAKPSLFLIELIDGQTVHQVAITDQKHKALQKHLIVGASYKFTCLKQNKIRYSDGRIAIVNISTADSSFIFYNNVKITIAQPKCDLIFYKGVVTDAIPTLGLYELDNRRLVYLNFLMGQCQVPMPEVGRKMTVYNAHFWRNTELKRCAFILCGRSCISIEKENTKVDTCSNKTNLLDNYGMLWMKNVWKALQRKFSINFIMQNVYTRHPVPIFQQQILLQYIGFHHTTNTNDKRHLTREFLSQPHECVFTESRKLSQKKIVLLLEAKEEMETYALRKLLMSKWSYHIAYHADTDALIGFLNTKNGCWKLSDATGVLPCIVMGTEEELELMYNAVICIKRYKCIVEVFKSKKHKILTYLQFNANDALILCPNETKHSEVTNKREGPNCKHQHAMKEKPDKEREICGKEQTSTDFSCLVRVLHKSTPAITSANDNPVCCILAVFADRKIEQKQLFLVLTGKLVDIQPVLHVGRVYKLFTPGQKIYRILKNCCKLKLLSQVLPDATGAVLPEDSKIIPVNEQRPAVNLTNNLYRVDDKSFHEEAGQRELVDVEGIITDRLHTQIKYESERYQSQVEYFGVPDNQSIVVKLQGSAGKNMEVTLYLNNWGSRAYPLGLIPGAQIQARFVAKYTTQSSARTYFQATELTRIYVLQLGQQENNTANNDNAQWTKPCILTKEASQAAPGTVLCGLISSLKMWKITAEVVCQYCTQPLNIGKCNNCIFSAVTPQLVLSANCFLEDLFGEVILLVQKNQVFQLFERPTIYWNVLARVIAKEHNKLIISDSDVPTTVSKKILHCMLTAFNNKPSHWLVLARKLRPQSSEQRNALLCMELQKPKPYFIQNLLKETSCLPNRFVEQHNFSAL